jgi:alpha-L-fucosidase
MRNIILLLIAALLIGATAKTKDEKTVQTEHGMIGLGAEKAGEHTQHPDAQWYPDAGFGLFLHYSICSVKAMNISWPMIPGRPLEAKRIDDPAERERIIREEDWDLKGKKPSITPNQYWAMAKDFNPKEYNPDKWLKAAKEAGFTYVVLTTRHHDGFALWPSAFGDFSTKNYMGGRDLVKEYVEACRKNGLKVGLYYSPPNWYFDRDYMSFLYHGGKNNPELPSLDADLKPRTGKPAAEDVKKHQAQFAELVKGQVEELLTNYGKIDLLWFDGKPAVPNATEVITQERIRELQPGIVINPRLHGKGDFITYERTLKTDKVATSWAEYCNTWNSNWSYTRTPYKADGFVLGQLAKCRSLGINYLLGIGPMANGDLAPEAYENMAVVAGWMKQNGASIKGTKPLPAGESASVPATAAGQQRYLFALPQFKGGGTAESDILPAEDLKLTVKGIAKPQAVRFLADQSPLKHDFSDGTLTIDLPAAKRSKLVDVVVIDLSGAPVGG